MKKTIKFVFLTLTFLCNYIEIKDNQLIAMEQENYNINNYTYDLNINSSKENIINSILTENKVSINGDVVLDYKIQSIDDFLNIDNISRYEMVDWLYDNSILTEEEKIECYCDLLINRKFDNAYCLTGVYSEIFEYNKKNTNSNDNLIKKTEIILSDINNNIIQDGTYTSNNFEFRYDSFSVNINEVINAANYFEEVRQAFIDMGFNTPILQPFHDKYIVYIQQEAGENPLVLGECRKKGIGKTCSSDIVIYYFQTLNDITKETITHEYFHAIQYAYNRQFTWFSEATANWAPLKINECYSNSINAQIEYISNNVDDSIFNIEYYGVALFPLTIDKNYGGFSTIKSIYEVYNSEQINLDFNELKEVITEGISNNGYTGITFDDIFVEMATYILNPEKYYSNSINSYNPDSFNLTQTNQLIHQTIINNNVSINDQTINSYASKYYRFDLADSLINNNNLTITFDFEFDNDGAQIQVYKVDYNDYETISYNVVYNQNKTLTIQDLGTATKDLYFVICNLNEEETLNMNINISYEHIHNYINGCTSNDAFGHTCKCSCGYSYIENHTFKPYSNGKKCLKCGYFTNGPVITPITNIKEINTK